MRIGLYLISLIGADKRRQAFKTQAPLHERAVSTIDAVDGRKMLAREYHAKLIRARYALTPSEMGCALSHCKAYKSAMEEGASIAAVFEDDVILDDAVFQRCLDIIKQLPPDGILILGGQDGLKSRKWLIGRLMPELGEAVYKIPRICRNQIWRTVGYAVGSSALRSILDDQNRSISKADDWSHLTRETNNFFYCELIRHPVDLAQSDIEAERQLTADCSGVSTGKRGLVALTKRFGEKIVIYSRIALSLLLLLAGYKFVPSRFQ